MSKLYLITGPAGVGKSTISNMLANKLEKSVLLEGDDFYHQVVGGYAPAWKPDNHLEIFWKVCIDVIKDYLDAGYDVVFNYIIGKKTFENIKQQLINYDIKFMVLLASEETILNRDLTRAEENRMNERCIVLLNQFKNYNFDENLILYTDNLKKEEIAEIILNKK